MPELAHEGSDPYRYDPNPELDELFEGRKAPADNRQTGHLRAWGGPMRAMVAYSGMSPLEALEYVEYDAEQNGSEIAFKGIKHALEIRIADQQEREEGRASAGITSQILI